MMILKNDGNFKCQLKLFKFEQTDKFNHTCNIENSIQMKLEVGFQKEKYKQSV